MDTTSPHKFLQRWDAVQDVLFPILRADYGDLTPKHEKLIHTLDFVRIEEFTADGCGVGRPPHERGWLANAFVAKAVLGMGTTAGLIDRIKSDRPLRRICGFKTSKDIPSESTFSRAFAEFAETGLAQRAHNALIKEQLGERLIGHINRDATAIYARERPAKGKNGDDDGDKIEPKATATPVPEAAHAATQPVAPEAAQAAAQPVAPEATQTAAQPVAPEAGATPAEPVPAKPAPAAEPVKKAKKRGRPRKGEERPPVKESPIARQRMQPLWQMLAELPTACDRGAKTNAQGYKETWNGYKLHIDTADCGVPISALLSSASMHDSRATIPLSLITKTRVTNLYDVMDAGYCSQQIQEHCRSLDHVPLIDHNPRGGLKDEFEPADAVRYRVHSGAERTNARLKDEFGGRNVMVKGHAKVTEHLMFGILALSADQLMRLRSRE